MFIQITHQLVGTERMFMPQGYSPFAISDETLAAENAADPGTTVLVNGDAVTVEAAFVHDLAQTGGVPSPIMFYVRSHRTGLATHVLIDDIKLELPLGTTRAWDMAWKPRPFANQPVEAFGPSPFERAVQDGRVVMLDEIMWGDKLESPLRTRSQTLAELDHAAGFKTVFVDAFEDPQPEEEHE